MFALIPFQLKKVPLQLVTGLQRLRGQLGVLVVQRCEVTELDDVVVRCGGDNSTSLAWTGLRELDLTHNRLRRLGDSLVRSCCMLCAARCLFVRLCICLFECLCICLCVYLYICSLFVYLYISLYILLGIFVFVHLFVCVCVYVRLCICVFVRLCICAFVCAFVCMCMGLWVGGEMGLHVQITRFDGRINEQGTSIAHLK